MPRPLVRRLIAWMIALVLMTPAVARSDDAGTTARGAEPSQQPVKISVGLLLLRIDSLDLKSETATITFYVWTSWRGDVDGSAFEIMNGTIDSKVSEFKSTKDGVQYAYYRCRATVNIDVDFKRYPFDTHRLSIVLEHSDFDVSRVVWEVDTSSMKHLNSPVRSGWSVGEPTYRVTESIYKTNWGVLDVPPDEATVMSRFTASIELKHEATATFSKTFLPLFISMLITFLAFLIHPGELEARVGIGVAGVFGAVTSQAVVSGNLPEIPYMTLSDQIHSVSLFFVFATLLASCYLGYLARNEQVAKAARMDVIIGLGVSVGYVVLVLALLAGL